MGGERGVFFGRVARFSSGSGLIDALKGAGLADGLPSQLAHLPLSEQGLAWLVPSVIVLAVAVVFARILGKPAQALA